MKVLCCPYFDTEAELCFLASASIINTCIWDAIFVQYFLCLLYINWIILATFIDVHVEKIPASIKSKFYLSVMLLLCTIQVVLYIMQTNQAC